MFAPILFAKLMITDERVANARLNQRGQPTMQKIKQGLIRVWLKAC